MKVPEDLYYSREHEWLKIEKDLAVVGITDYAQHELGDIAYIELPKVGDEVKQFEKMCEIESVKAVSDIFSPISGEIVEVNQELENAPELINEDPYKAWIVKIKVLDKKELENLMSAKEYRELTE